MLRLVQLMATADNTAGGRATKADAGQTIRFRSKYRERGRQRS